MSEDELERIRRRKTEQLMRLMEQRKRGMEELQQADEPPKSISEADKLTLMQYFLTPDAYEYWLNLYNNELKRPTAETIFLNVLYLIKIGFLEGKQVSRIGIKKLERKIEGIPPSITIKRKGQKEKQLS